MNTYRNDTYNRHGGYRDRGQYINNNGGIICLRCFTCFKSDDIIPKCPFKDEIDLKFCTKCGVGDHSLEDFPIMLEKIMSKKIVNHLLRVHKNYILNSKILQIITK